jgi:YVTN family beta-propeller protein
MKLRLSFGLCLCLAAASGQYLEATIPLPLSPEAIAWSSAGNRAYCAVGYPDARGLIVVIDGATNALVDSVPLPYQMPGALAVDPGRNRLYCVGSSYYPLDESLATIIDCTADSVVAHVQVGGGPLALCHNPGTGRLYTASQLADRAYVIDCDAETVRARPAVGANPYAMVYAPEVNKVYCANRGVYGRADFRVTVINGASDSVTRNVGVGLFPLALCYNRSDRKVYCANGWDASLSVIAADSDVVAATIPAGASPYALGWNPVNDRVYCASTEHAQLRVIDGVTNQVVTTVTLPGPAWALAVDSAANKVYASLFTTDQVAVIDGATNAVLTTIAVGSGPRALCHNPASGRMYVANREGNSLSVIRDTTSSSIAAPRGERPVSTIATTVVRGVLRLGGTANSVLFDAGGRRRLALAPGDNDVGGLRPGVYFLPDGARARKVIIAR